MGVRFRRSSFWRAVVALRFTSGIVLYDGETAAPFGEGLYAVPVRALWEMG